MSVPFPASHEPGSEDERSFAEAAAAYLNDELDPAAKTRLEEALANPRRAAAFAAIVQLQDAVAAVQAGTDVKPLRSRRWAVRCAIAAGAGVAAAICIAWFATATPTAGPNAELLAETRPQNFATTANDVSTSEAVAMVDSPLAWMDLSDDATSTDSTDFTGLMGFAFDNEDEPAALDDEVAVPDWLASAVLSETPEQEDLL